MNIKNKQCKTDFFLRILYADFRDVENRLLFFQICDKWVVDAVTCQQFFKYTKKKTS